MSGEALRLQATPFAPPVRAGSLNCTGSSSHPHTRQISYVPGGSSSSVSCSQHGQGYIAHQSCGSTTSDPPVLYDLLHVGIGSSVRGPGVGSIRRARATRSIFDLDWIAEGARHTPAATGAFPPLRSPLHSRDFCTPADRGRHFGPSSRAWRTGDLLRDIGIRRARFTAHAPRRRVDTNRGRRRGRSA